MCPPNISFPSVKQIMVLELEATQTLGINLLSTKAITTQKIIMTESGRFELFRYFRTISAPPI